MRITVVGAGYVGISNALLLAQHNEVVLFDIDDHKVSLIQNRQLPIQDTEANEFFQHKQLNLKATTDKRTAYKNAKFVIIATPTDYDPVKNHFDTSSVEKVAKEALACNPNAVLVIKSTVPVGFTKQLKKVLANRHIIFSPEFLREGSALHDNLYPSRIIVGDSTAEAKLFACLLLKGVNSP